MEQIERRLYNLKSVANILDVSVATIYRRLDSDTFFPKPTLVGGKNLWSDIQIKEYIEFIEQGGYNN